MQSKNPLSYINYNSIGNTPNDKYVFNVHIIVLEGLNFVG